MSYTIEGVKKAIGDTTKLSADGVKEAIMTKGKVPFGQVQKVYKALGYVTVRASVADTFYNTLRDKPMTDDAFTKWIAAGSKNVKAHKNHYNAIRLLANDIHAAK